MENALDIARTLKVTRGLTSDGTRPVTYFWRPESVPAIEGFRPLSFDGNVQSPSEFRWDEEIGEWVGIAPNRAARVVATASSEAPSACSLCPSEPGETPTEIPASRYDLVAFQNKSSTLLPNAVEPGADNLRAQGVAEVVCFNSNHYLGDSIADLAVANIEDLLKVYAHRTCELGELSYVKYVLGFQNKGARIGVTQPHPHGQIYAYPFVPVRIARLLANERTAFDSGYCLQCRALRQAEEDGLVVARYGSCVAIFKRAPKYPYEVRLLPLRHVGMLGELSDAERLDLAVLLKVVMVAFGKLPYEDVPYMLGIEQSSSDGEDHSYHHLAVRIVTPMRKSPDIIKHFAGAEEMGGTIFYDALPEERADELRRLADEFGVAAIDA